MEKRNFYLGDDWLYYKIYVGNASANTVLIEYLRPFTKELLEKKLIKIWFYIRYQDPDPHIRFRVKMSDISSLGEIIFLFKELTTPINREIIRKIETCDYNRELERYGIGTIEYTEELFFYDSQLILDVIDIASDDEECFLFLLKILSVRIDSFKFDLEDKIKLLNKIQLRFKNEFKIDQKFLKSLSRKYRDFHKAMKLVLDPESENFHPFHNFLKGNTDSASIIIDKILKKEQVGSLGVEKDEYICSIMHMNVNRMFRSKQRIYEMVAYDFLFNYYNSKLKRKEFTIK